MPFRIEIRCVECNREFDAETKFIEVNGDRYCEDCIDDMRPKELLDIIGVGFDCIGYPEPERC